MTCLLIKAPGESRIDHVSGASWFAVNLERKLVDNGVDPGNKLRSRLRSRTETSYDSRIEAAKDGAEWAWAAIYEELSGPVTGYLRNRGAADPEDLSSEVFLQVARDIHRFDGDETKFRSWVFVIAHRRLIDERRFLARRPDEIDNLGDGIDFAGGDVEEEVMAHLSDAKLQEILETLTEDQRHVLALRIIGDLTLEETALVLHKRVSAIKALQRRALGAVKASLEKGRVTL
jgi:RNA polymerase sigma-70 factor (ECF subfamily)